MSDGPGTEEAGRRWRTAAVCGLPAAAVAGWLVWLVTPGLGWGPAVEIAPEEDETFEASAVRGEEPGPVEASEAARGIVPEAASAERP